MDHVELNSILRNIVRDLLQTGKYKKRDIVVATLGGGSSPQFEHFLKGSDVGIKPLSRLFESFGYDLEIVPVPKEDSEKALTSQSIKTLDANFVKDCKESLVTYLDSEEAKSTVRGSVSKVFETVADDLLADIIK